MPPRKGGHGLASAAKSRTIIDLFEDADNGFENAPPPDLDPRRRTQLGHSPPRPRSAGMAKELDVPWINDEKIRIVIATDLHLGYLEEDPIRGNDSFLAFEEVLAIAREVHADMMLVAGDFFHQNRPSAITRYMTNELLVKYCQGDENIGGQRPLQWIGKRLPRGELGQGPNLAYSAVTTKLPIFTIHGNHDEPTGTSHRQMSVLDDYHMAGFLNYFGKQANPRKIQLEPLVFQKGVSKLALYGMGNMRDDSLVARWQDPKSLEWKSPEEMDPDVGSNFTTIFTLHQNRALRGSSDALTRDMMPDWLDVVVWGHEHECRIDLEGENPAITQPGSTVATSLTDGEAAPKHIALLTIDGDNIEFTKIPLVTPRVFKMKTVYLKDQPGLLPADEAAVMTFLSKTIEEMLREAELMGRGSTYADLQQRQNEFSATCAFYRRPLENMWNLPLIRLRVEHSGGYSICSSIRFGQQFVNRVANSADLLNFFKQRVIPPRKGLIRGRVVDAGEADPSRLDGANEVNGGEAQAEVIEGNFLMGLGAKQDEEKRADIQVTDLWEHFLGRQTKKLSMFSIKETVEAMEAYVKDEENDALEQYISKLVENAEHLLEEKKTSVEVEQITEVLDHEREQRDREVLAYQRTQNLDVQRLKDFDNIQAEKRAMIEERMNALTTAKGRDATVAKAKVASQKGGDGRRAFKAGNRREPKGQDWGLGGASGSRPAPKHSTTSKRPKYAEEGDDDDDDDGDDQNLVHIVADDNEELEEEKENDRAGIGSKARKTVTGRQRVMLATKLESLEDIEEVDEVAIRPFRTDIKTTGTNKLPKRAVQEDDIGSNDVTVVDSDSVDEDMNPKRRVAKARGSRGGRGRGGAGRDGGTRDVPAVRRGASRTTATQQTFRSARSTRDVVKLKYDDLMDED